MTASEISLAEKAFYKNQWSKTFAVAGGGTVTLEAKAPMKKIMVCTDAPSRLKKEERRQLMRDEYMMRAEPGLPAFDVPPPEFEPPKGGSGAGSGTGEEEYIKKMRDDNPFMKDVKAG